MLRFLRMHRTLLTIRIQAIDGVGTYTPLDSQPCRLLQCNCDCSSTDCAGDEEIANYSSREIVSNSDEYPTESAKCPLG